MEVNQMILNQYLFKGPSAAALYGTRASNGVIVIKTKDGRQKKGCAVSFNTSITMDSAFKLPQFLNTDKEILDNLLLLMV
jgi:TonB-dependent SusC/RagA subfamily outer membrane receptor